MTIRDYHNNASVTGVDHGHHGNRDHEVVARAQWGNREVRPRSDQRRVNRRAEGPRWFRYLYCGEPLTSERGLQAIQPARTIIAHAEHRV